MSLNTLPEDIKEECRTFDVPKSYLVQIVRSKPEERHQFWEAYKKGEVKTVRGAKQRKAGEEITKAPPKPKKNFHTAHKASVIVQSETSRLTRTQIISALGEALDQAQKEKPGKSTQ